MDNKLSHRERARRINSLGIRYQAISAEGQYTLWIIHERADYRRYCRLDSEALFVAALNLAQEYARDLELRAFNMTKQIDTFAREAWGEPLV